MADLPLPQQKTGRWRLSIVWLVPAVAALIGGWMAFRTFSDRGPTITLVFQSGEGLEPGQTRIRVRNVNIGKVSSVGLSHDLSKVLVTAELRKEVAGLLSENSRFWIVRARIGSAGISGLGTLLSGAYIGFDPGKPGAPGSRPPTSFEGLETPPIVTTHEPGLLLTLRAEQLGSLNIGSPVHFRQIQVGEVAGFDLDPDGKSVSIKIFIHAPYDKLVRLNTRFWDAGGVELTADANGVRLRSTSAVALLLGGIAFENPVSLEDGDAAPGDHVFTLYPNHDKTQEKQYQERHYFVVNFKESVRGLTRGAPVEFRGIKVGQVEDFNLEFHPGTLEGKVPVLIAVEPERFTIVGRPKESTERIMEKLLARGLRAQLKMGSLITGGLVVDLAFHPGGAPRALTRHGAYLEIPSEPSSLGAMVDNLSRFAARLDQLPLEKVVAEVRASLPELRAALKEAQALMAQVRSETAPQAGATLRQAQATLASLDQMLRSDSPTQQDLRKALESLTRAARSMKELADTLERHPESLLFGKGKKP